MSTNPPPPTDAQLRLGKVLLQQERRVKIELTVVALLWLVGCPILCWLDRTGGTLYGTPEPSLCGLQAYSVSASMTGDYPKIWGSIVAPLFAVLVVQRSSGGLCANVKLGLLSRFSLLLTHRNREQVLSSPTNTKKLTTSTTTGKKNQQAMAVALWNRIETIEYLGYLAGCFLLILVILDSRDFLNLHCTFAIVAFALLYSQNRLIGNLGTDFPEIFPTTWASPWAKTVFQWGVFHVIVYHAGMFIIGAFQYHDRCEDLVSGLSKLLFGGRTSPETTIWLVSIMFWSNEYIFALLWVYVQMLEHFEMVLWEFVGAESMTYTSIVSKFSILRAIQRLFLGCFTNPSDADTFLGIPPPKESSRTANNPDDALD